MQHTTIAVDLAKSVFQVAISHLQRFASVHGVVQNLLRVGRHRLRATHHRVLQSRAFVEWEAVTGASVIKRCYAATGMYMTVAAAVLRESANTRTSLSHMATRRRDTKMSRRNSRRVASPACIAGVRVSRPNFNAPCVRTKL